MQRPLPFPAIPCSDTVRLTAHRHGARPRYSCVLRPVRLCHECPVIGSASLIQHFPPHPPGSYLVFPVAFESPPAPALDAGPLSQSSSKCSPAARARLPIRETSPARKTGL